MRQTVVHPPVLWVLVIGGALRLPPMCRWDPISWEIWLGMLSERASSKLEWVMFRSQIELLLLSMRVIRYRDQEDIPSHSISRSHSISDSISISHSLSQLERGISFQRVIQSTVRVWVLRQLVPVLQTEFIRFTICQGHFNQWNSVDLEIQQWQKSG